MAEVADSQLSGTPPDAGYRERYPWHADLWGRLWLDPSRLSHALLLHGPAGLGKRAFAWRLAHAILCLDQGPQGKACERCMSCQRFVAGTHPDLVYVGLLEDATAITIDQIRAVRDFVVLKPHTARRKLVILDAAERMNANAANALLKILEEPPASSALLLVASQPTRLPATIRSRCTGIIFRVPPVAMSATWLAEQGVSAAGKLLQFAAGAPLHALALSTSSDIQDCEQVRKDIDALREGKTDPLTCAARWKGYGAERCLAWFQSYLAELLRARAESRELSSGDKDLFIYFDVLSRSKLLADGPLDESLLLEDLLIRWAGMFRRVG